MHVSEFYMKRGAYLAAIGRARHVIEHLPNTPQTPYALSVLVEAYELLDYKELKASNLAILKANYPDFILEENKLASERSWVNVLSLGMLGRKAPAPSKL